MDFGLSRSRTIGFCDRASFLSLWPTRIIAKGDLRAPKKKHCANDLNRRQDLPGDASSLYILHAPPNPYPTSATPFNWDSLIAFSSLPSSCRPDQF